MSRSTFYYQLERLTRVDKYLSQRKLIKETYHRHKGRYGYRRIKMELDNNGCRLNHKTVYKLMKEEGLKSRVRPKRYQSYKGEVGKIAPNLLAGDFYAFKPNQKWATDVTEFKIGRDRLYLSPIIDLYTKEIISYSLGRKPAFELTMQMLDDAFNKYPDLQGLIFHSDQGWQYQMYSYRQRLKEKGIRQSMSRKATPKDNAVIENFFGLLKTELIYLQDFNSIEQLEKEIKLYIVYYNNKRIKLKFKGLTPVQYREISLNKSQV